VFLKLNKFLKISWFNHNKSGTVVNKKKEKEMSDKLLGFLLGFGAGTVIYGLLSLFQKYEPKSVCPICKAEIDIGTSKCPKCKTSFRWSQ
jgi:hypothetical protein